MKPTSLSNSILSPNKEAEGTMASASHDSSDSATEGLSVSEVNDRVEPKDLNLNPERRVSRTFTRAQKKSIELKQKFLDSKTKFVDMQNIDFSISDYTSGFFTSTFSFVICFREGDCVDE